MEEEWKRNCIGGGGGGLLVRFPREEEEEEAQLNCGFRIPDLISSSQSLAECRPNLLSFFIPSFPIFPDFVVGQPREGRCQKPKNG